MSLSTEKALRDYEQTEALLRACRQTFRRLADEHRAARQALDQATNPHAAPAAAPASTQNASIPALRFSYRGTTVSTRFAVDAYCAILARIWIDFPDRR